jgi:hypothetical protein
MRCISCFTLNGVVAALHLASLSSTEQRCLPLMICSHAAGRACCPEQRLHRRRRQTPITKGLTSIDLLTLCLPALHMTLASRCYLADMTCFAQALECCERSYPRVLVWSFCHLTGALLYALCFAHCAAHSCNDRYRPSPVSSLLSMAFSRAPDGQGMDLTTRAVALTFLVGHFAGSHGHSFHQSLQAARLRRCWHVPLVFCCLMCATSSTSPGMHGRQGTVHTP